MKGDLRESGIIEQDFEITQQVPWMNGGPVVGGENQSIFNPRLASLFTQALLMLVVHSQDLNGSPNIQGERKGSSLRTRRLCARIAQGAFSVLTRRSLIPIQ